MIDTMRLEQICREAGHIAHGKWPGTGYDLKSWDKTPGSPVCEADLDVDAFLKRELASLLPAAGWLSEETRDSEARLDRGLAWLVDPIDGTRDFIRGRKGWAVSVALVSGGRPLLGTLVAPARGEVWSATAGKGAWRNGERLRASTRTRFSGARVPADSLSKDDRDLTMVEKPNSIALRIAMVASDEADLVATVRWGFEWDVAAAALIAREAGARVSDAFGQPLTYNKRDPRAFGLLVSSPAIHDAAIVRLKERAERLAG
ncbi:3'(2'),5'-bisphosphate nucleotidase CysQ [Aurantiacibacter spongiae]|uniref:3'(2'),5'-bisphosphate nucleotidase CysQ n=1 Tax=Aurantiacibacter spongiae TaxID=2488860 RepID=A0A3N5CQJ3_9SPHN|nr:3'(2'),5'-bisphosphate nucleotidase CysQ [Aurantiacibacter spongiae]RPF71333.1 3'(2'),5'-bisphosphate nucleotidase CysQ [Aurantiacibacter spongiae]